MPISSALGSSALLPAGLGFRNVLINGDFRVWQRGTSFTWSSGQPYTADRWCITPGGTAAFSASRQTASLDGFQYCFRLQRTAANTNTSALYVSQPIETITSIPLANKQITFSFNARAGANFSAASSILNVRIITGTGTDGNFLVATLTGQATLLDTTATLTTSWQKFTYSVLVPSGVNQIQPVLLYTPSGTAGAADYFEITGVQLEQNYQPTPFEQRPIGTELALCQRYYQRFTSSSGGPGIFCLGMFGGGTSAARNLLSFYVPMRSLASSVDFSAANTFWLNSHNIANYNVSSITYNTFSGNTVDALEVAATPSSSAGAAGTTALLVAANLTAYIGVNAEL